MVNITSHMNKKADYKIITIFFFIICLVIVTLGIVYYYRSVIVLNNQANLILERSNSILLVKDNLYQCFGEIFDPRLLETMGCLNGQNIADRNLGTLIEGFQVEQKAIKGCNHAQWNWTKPDTKGLGGDQYIYYIPIYNNQTGAICLGRLMMWT